MKKPTESCDINHINLHNAPVKARIELLTSRKQLHSSNQINLPMPYLDLEKCKLKGI